MIDLRFSDYFLYTQFSLSTFDNCPLKFKKRYLENLKWNNIPDPEIKKRLEMGNDFHLLAYRYFMGIDGGLEEVSSELSVWINSLKKNFRIDAGCKYLPEYKLRLNAGALKLEANFDLLKVREDSIEIWDWKTHSETKKNTILAGKSLSESLQTVVYLFVLKELSSLVIGKNLECGKITMHYWQPSPPMVQASIEYSEEMHQHFKNILENKINKISNFDYSSFDKEMFKKHCKYCEFNWYCNNEKIDFRAVEEAFDVMEGFDWDSIEERY